MKSTQAKPVIYNQEISNQTLDYHVTQSKKINTFFFPHFPFAILAPQTPRVNLIIRVLVCHVVHKAPQFAAPALEVATGQPEHGTRWFRPFLHGHNVLLRDVADGLITDPVIFM